MTSIKKIIGRDPSCDYVIFDPKNRVSRKHVELSQDNNHYFLKDLKSLNGAYLNGRKVVPGNLMEIGFKDKITLSSDYILDLKLVFPTDDDATRILNVNSQSSIVFDHNNTIFRDKQRTVVFDRDKTQISDILLMDETPFVSIGRETSNTIVINNKIVSSHHCKIRLLTPVMIEVEDLNSTNGTYADGEKLTHHKRCQYSSSVIIRLGSSINLNLKTIFPGIHILPKTIPAKLNPQVAQTVSNVPLSKREMEAFNELQTVWKEYSGRQNQANNVSLGFTIGGTILGLVAAAYTGGAAIPLITSGGGILGRFLGQQKSNKIMNNLTFEDAFLQTYACPRCKESFQKKPWITIRECYRCKAKFR